MTAKNHILQIAATDKITTSYAGLIPFLNALRNSDFPEKIEKIFGYKKRRQRGYSVSEKLLSILALIYSGGEHFTDIAQIERDEGLKELLNIKHLPAPSVISDFLNTVNTNDITEYYFLNIKEAVAYYRRNRIKTVTLDIDSVLSENDKEVSEWSYKKFKAFNPMFLVDETNGLVLAGIFRNGNASPQTDILRILKDVLAEIKKTECIEQIRVRIDSAGYQLEIIEFLESNKIDYTITGDSSSAKIELFKAISEDKWAKYDNEYEIAASKDFIRSGKKELPISLVVKRRLKKEIDLFGKYEYYYAVYNISMRNSKEIVKFHAHRANAENIFKALKGDFWLANFPCHSLEGNAFFMQIMISAYNLFGKLKEMLLEPQWRRHTLRTIRYRIIQVAGIVIRHGRRMILKINKRYRFLKEIIKSAKTSQYSFA